TEVRDGVRLALARKRQAQQNVVDLMTEVGADGRPFLLREEGQQKLQRLHEEIERLEERLEALDTEALSLEAEAEDMETVEDSLRALADRLAEPFTSQERQQFLRGIVREIRAEVRANGTPDPVIVTRFERIMTTSDTKPRVGSSPFLSASGRSGRRE